MAALLLASPASGEVVATDALPLAHLGPHLELLTDVPPEATLGEVQAAYARGEFVRTNALIPSFGVQQPVVWARFELENPDPTPRTVVLVFEYAVADSVELMTPKSSGNDDYAIAGDAVVDSANALAYKQPAFPIALPAGSRTLHYLRIETTASQTLPISLETEASFAARAQSEQLLFGLLFGAIGLFLVYTASISLFLRSASCAWFSIYVTSLGALVAVREGYVRQWLGDAGTTLNTPLNLVVLASLFFFGAKLLRDFLNVRRISRRDDWILRGLQYGALFWLPLALAESPWSALVGLPVMGIGPIFSSALAFRYWAKGVPNARYFALGWAFAHVNSLIDVLYITGAIGYAPFMQYLMPVSLGLATSFFAFAIIEQTYNYQTFARQDGLTGLANRRRFAEHLEAEWLALERDHDPVSIVMVDVDEFKRFNDRYGHVAGDEALRAIAPLLQNRARRRGDLAARYGGEEFVVLLSRTAPDHALRMAESLRMAVEGLAIPHESSGISDAVTVSVGVATGWPGHGTTAAELLDRADAALYESKEHGRNRVTMAAVPTRVGTGSVGTPVAVEPI